MKKRINPLKKREEEVNKENHLLSPPDSDGSSAESSDKEHHKVLEVSEDEWMQRSFKERSKDVFESVLNPDEFEVPEDLKAPENIKENKWFHRLMNISTVVLLITFIVLAIIGYKKGIFKSEADLVKFVNSLGPWAPVVFTLIQAVQVVIPILPGAIGCAVGVLAFGPWMGLIYNYVGICFGSLAAFALSRQYGKPFVIRMIGQKNYNKYIGWTGNSKRYERIFALLIFLPVAPDDILCYITGLTEMTFKKYSVIIFACKPFSISLYSLGLTALMTNFWHWLVSLGV